MARRSAGRGRPAAALACPSAPHDWDGALLLGVVTGSVDRPQVRYPGPREFGPDLLELARPAHPEEVFRFTAPCRESGCSFFRNGRCGVGEAAVAGLPDELDAPLPQCGIRTDCRWWAEHGPAACRRCSRVVTEDAGRPETFATALNG